MHTLCCSYNRLTFECVKNEMHKRLECGNVTAGSGYLRPSAVLQCLTASYGWMLSRAAENCHAWPTLCCQTQSDELDVLLYSMSGCQQWKVCVITQSQWHNTSALTFGPSQEKKISPFSCGLNWVRGFPNNSDTDSTKGNLFWTAFFFFFF